MLVAKYGIPTKTHCDFTVKVSQGCIDIGIKFCN